MEYEVSSYSYGVDKRVYAVIAESVWTPINGTVIQVPGRMAAQACHAVSRMKMFELIVEAPKVAKKQHILLTEAQAAIANAEITTILLGCRDSNELRHVHRLLELAEIGYYLFEDTNPEVYGQGRVENILDYLPLAFSK